MSINQIANREIHQGHVELVYDVGLVAVITFIVATLALTL